MILALDLGTKMGFALCDEAGNIVSGTQKFNETQFSGGGWRFMKFREWLQTLHAIQGPITEVVYEEVRRHRGTAAAHCYGGFLAILTAFCEEQAVTIPYHSVGVGQIKKFFAKNGNASKEQMIAAAQRRGHDPKDDNEADALGIMYYRLNEIGETDKKGIFG